MTIKTDNPGTPQLPQGCKAVYRLDRRDKILYGHMSNIQSVVRSLRPMGFREAPTNQPKSVQQRNEELLYFYILNVNSLIYKVKFSIGYIPFLLFLLLLLAHYAVNKAIKEPIGNLLPCLINCTLNLFNYNIFRTFHCIKLRV